MTMKKLALAAAALGLACTTTAPAFAGNVEKMSVRVNLGDINLASPSGQKLLDRRIAYAARTVCRADVPTTGSRILTQEKRDCLVKARADARQQVAAITGDRQRGG
jgi:UrcA family protein